MATENETHEEVCAEMRSFEDVPPPRFAWRDLAERAEAAHKRELAAKDALIRELADALLSFLAILKNPCSTKQCSEECKIKFREMSSLVAKAREVCK